MVCPMAGGFSVSRVVDDEVSLVGEGASLGCAVGVGLAGLREVGVVDGLAGAGEDSSLFCANPVVENIATAKNAERRSDRFRESREVLIMRDRVRNSERKKPRKEMWLPVSLLRADERVC